MIISDQAPALFEAVFSDSEAIPPHMYQLFSRAVGCINEYTFRSHTLAHGYESGGDDSIKKSKLPQRNPWWEQLKEFKDEIHPLTQLTGATSNELASCGFDMTPEIEMDVIVRIWNSALKSLREKS